MTLRVTRTGKAIARTGLEPVSVDNLLEFFATKQENLRQLLNRDAENSFVEEDDFEFVVLHALFSSDEYHGDASYHYLPYQMFTEPLTGPQDKLVHYIYELNNYPSVNAAIHAYRWIRGTDIKALETTLDIRSGVLTSLFSESASLLRGLADILYATASRRQGNVVPTALDSLGATSLAIFVAPLRALAKRLIDGLPEELLWMCELQKEGDRILSRNEIIALRDHNLTTPDAILDGGQKSIVLQALGSISPQSQGKTNDILAATNGFKLDSREKLKAGQVKRLPECEALILEAYTAKGTDFETCVEKIWDCIGLTIEDRDDNTKNAFPDFIIAPTSDSKWAVECKSKTSGNYVEFNDATDVIRKANTNGYKQAFKITVCQPFVATNVPRQLVSCDELCVVNADDLIEGAIRVKKDQLSQDGFVDWLTTPGQASREFLIAGD